jgi:cytochrome c553
MAYTLRDLPLPVKVVATVFLLAVGAGYLSAMVQLHLQDSKSGKPMPTVADVILKYTGKKKHDPNAAPPAPVSRLEALVTNPTVAISGQSMSAAFTKEDRAKGELKYANAIKGKSPELVEIINAQRAGEQTVFKLWIHLPDAERRAAYEADKFEVPPEQMPTHLTNAFRAGTTVKIKSILDARCATCHSKGGEKEDVPLETYDQLAKFMAVDVAAPSGDWVKVEEPISVTKLTQSTHAHLLSFAVLFSLTGLIFALSSYPVSLRCLLGPWVVLAVFADVSLWWLARLSDQWGPYFAMGIIGTGGLAGMGLAAQITLSLFNMYGRAGKAVIALIFAAGLAVIGAVAVGVIAPALSKKDEQSKPTEVKGKDTPPVGNKQDAPQPIPEKKDDVPPKAKDKVEGPTVPPSALEKLLAFPVKGPDGKVLSMEETPWTGGDDGNMARAFYDKEKAYKDFCADASKPQTEKDKLTAERDGERRAVIAWIRTGDAPRKAAYDSDAFPLPPDLAGKPLTSKYAKDGKIAVKTIIADRCLRCHGEGGKQYDEYPLDTYEGLKKYMHPDPAAAAAPARMPKIDAPAPAAAPAPKPANPIPDAKDD